MVVEYSTSPSFASAARVTGPRVSAETDFVGKVTLPDLPSGTRIHYRARFDDSAWSAGSFITAPSARTTPDRDVLLAWSGDTNGQGWGIDPTRGGMPAYAALADRRPDLFIHCGDAIYGDNPIPETLEIPAADGGGIWKNIVDPAKSHVAQTLDDFRGAHRYPRRSAEVRLLSSVCPQFSIWDDHEVRNNWFPGEVIPDDVAGYTERRIDVLAAHARRAMYEYVPTLRDPSTMYRVVPWGPLADIFFVDGRTYRTPNEPAPPEGALLGAAQASWLLEALAASRAVWKIIACDMPIALMIADPGKTVAWANDGWSNSKPGAPGEREVELAKLLSGLRSRKVKNVVWLAADVHYAAAHRFDPSRAQGSKDFDPFWEFVAGPMHATQFPQKPLDDTFGPEVVWSSATPSTFGSPASGAQYFGLLHIDAKSHAMKVSFVDARGRDLHSLSLTPSL